MLKRLSRFLSIMTTPAIAKSPRLSTATSTSNISKGFVPKPTPNGLSYASTVVLAPMVRTGELPMRLLSLMYGASLVWGPETVDRALIGCTRRVNPRTQTVEFTRPPPARQKPKQTDADADAIPPFENVVYRLHPSLERGKLIFQIGSANPKLAVEAAKLVAADVAGIDLNAGCPKSFSTDGGMGAALLQEPDKLIAILEALVCEVGTPLRVPISVKIRILQPPERTTALVRRLVRTGISNLTVHCRTPSMRKTERVVRDQVADIVSICHDAGITCILNGDVASHAHARTLMSEFGVDGAMIAIAAERNPSCFLPESSALLPSRTVVRDYVRFALQCENRFANTKYQLALLMSGKDSVFADVARSRSYVDVVHALDLDDELATDSESFADLARAADEYTGVNWRRADAERKLRERDEKMRRNIEMQQQQKRQRQLQRQRQQQQKQHLKRRSPTEQDNTFID